MPFIVSPSDDQIATALRTVLIGILPVVPDNIIQGQVNRVPEPPAEDFVVFWPMMRLRLETNIDGTQDAKFLGSIAGDQMTITDVEIGSLAVGSPVFAVGVADNTTVVAFGTGSGGVGTYTITPAQTLAATTISAGTKTSTQNTEVRYQCDAHGPNSAAVAQLISTLFRNAYGVDAFAAINAAMSPLYADDPKQMPFNDGEEQYEDRWVIDIVLQVNISVFQIPQQFADGLAVQIVSVDAQYPP